jgi:vacuolar-type H+-ATPase subunit D/Vma8
MPAGDIDLDQIKAAMKGARSVHRLLPGKRAGITKRPSDSFDETEEAALKANSRGAGPNR